MAKDIVAVVLVVCSDEDPMPVGFTKTSDYVSWWLFGGEPVEGVSGRYFGLDNPISQEDLPRIGQEMMEHWRRCIENSY